MPSDLWPNLAWVLENLNRCTISLSNAFAVSTECLVSQMWGGQLKKSKLQG